MADFRVKQHLSMSASAQIKNLVPETLTEPPAEEEWKVGRTWFNSTMGKFQSIFLKLDEATKEPLEPQELEVKVLGESDKDATKISYSFKKSLGKEHSLSTKKWYEEEDGIILYQDSKYVWIDKISETPELTDERFITTYTDFEITHDSSVIGRKAFYMRETNGTRIRGFIPNGYGVGFDIKVKIDGNLIAPSHASGYLFDYANGILTFESTPPVGVVTVDVYEYTGRTFSQYIDAESNSVARGMLGVDTPDLEYTIQHNMASFDVDVTIYVFDEVDGTNYWKKDVVPMILLDENRVKLQLTEAHPIRFIVKSYETPEL